jgi:DNA repair protein RadD
VDDLQPLLARRELMDQQVAEWARLNGGRATLAYPVTLEHSMALCERFHAAGVRAVHLDAHTKNRAEIVRDLNEGRIPVVSSVGILSEGTNLPRVKSILGVRPTRSLVLYTQQYMRGATPWNGVEPRVFDVVGNCYTFGFPFEDRRWSLVNEESGLPLGRDGGVVKRCPNCGALVTLSSPSCTGCHESFPAPAPVVPTSPLRLEEVSPEKRQLTEEMKRLVAYAENRGFKNPEAWATDVLKLKHREAA